MQSPSLSGVLLTTILLCSCDAPNLSKEAAQEPFWISSPTLPKRPKQFCGKATEIFRKQAHSIRCQDNVAGAYGVRGRIEDVEMVVLQGANEEWFAFAYQLTDKPLRDPKTGNLMNLVSHLEAAFPPQAR